LGQIYGARVQVALESYQRPESKQFWIEKTVELGIKRSKRLQAAGWEEEEKNPTNYEERFIKGEKELPIS